MRNIVLSLLFFFVHKKVVSQEDYIRVYIRDNFLQNLESKAKGNKIDNAYFSKPTNVKSFTTAKKVPAKKSVHIKDPTAYCRSFSTCFKCSTSKWYPCGWCHNYGCTDKPQKFCAYAMTKHDFVKSNTTKNLRNLCPYIQHNGPILIPAGVRQNIQVKLHASDPVLYEKELVCQLEFPHRVTRLKALILNNVVYCYPVTLDTLDHGTTDIGSMRLIWGGVQPFSNMIPVSVYRCDSLASKYESICRLIPREYGCTWCAENNVCTIADKCPDHLKRRFNRLTYKSLGSKMFYF